MNFLHRTTSRIITYLVWIKCGRSLTLYHIQEVKLKIKFQESHQERLNRSADILNLIDSILTFSWIYKKSYSCTCKLLNLRYFHPKFLWGKGACYNLMCKLMLEIGTNISYVHFKGFKSISFAHLELYKWRQNSQSYQWPA